MLTDRFDESLDFFTRVYGLKLSGRDGDSRLPARLGRLRVPLAEAHPRPTPPASATSPTAPPRRRRWSAGSRRSRPRATRSIGWIDGDLGHGRAFRFEDPVRPRLRDLLRHRAGTSRRPRPSAPALKNTASRLHRRRAAAARPPEPARRGRDRVPPLHGDLPRLPRHRADPARQRPHRRLLVHRQQQDLRPRLHRGARPGPRAGCTTSPTPPTSARTSCAPPTSSCENGVHIETGPHKHAIQGTFFLYVWEPAGNRVELANAGARLILAPDWEPVVWTEADRRKGQAWGLKTIETFHTHGTPPVKRSEEA